MGDFQKDFDELLAGLLTDYRNQFPEADTSQGSLIFIKSACLASALWGIYKHQEYISRQIFPDTADSAGLDHHGYVRGVARTYQETDSAYLARLLEYIRRPPAGGNQYDYVKWALEVDGVRAAYVFPLAQGLNSVDVVILADADIAGSRLPSDELIAVVKAYIDERRPVTASFVRVLGPTELISNVILTVTGAANIVQIKADIEAYMLRMVPGTSMYLSQLVTIAIANGADNATVIEPAETVAAYANEMICPGVIDVSIA